MSPLRRFAPSSRWARLGLAAAVSLTTVVPAYAAPLGNQHPILVTAKPTTTPAPPRAITTGAGSTVPAVLKPIKSVGNTSPNHVAVGFEVNPPNALNAPTLKITAVSPSPAVEGQPVKLSFQLTNN